MLSVVYEPFEKLLQCIGVGQIQNETSNTGGNRMNVTELEKCISLYGNEIYSFCRRLTNSKLEADELYQDTFLKAVEMIEQIQPESNPKSYLLSIAVRLWNNKRRKYAWRNRIAGMENLTEEKQDLCRGENCSVEEQIIAQEQAAVLRKKINELGDKYRVPIYLYYMEELSIKEISKVLKIPKGTVKSRLFKAREVLKKKLEVEFYEG